MSKPTVGKAKAPRLSGRAKELARALAAIEMIVGDDACEIWDMEAPRLRGRSREMHAKLSAVYRMAHGANPTHSCYHVHFGWREEINAVIEASS